MRTLIITICLLCLASFVMAEPNDVNAPVISDSNLIAHGDGIIAGYVVKESENNSLAKIGYQYGISQFFALIGIEEKGYYEFGVKWESRDIAQQDSVPALSEFILMIAPEKSEITGTAGISRSWNGNDSYFNGIGGINIRPNQDKNLLIEIEGVTPVDQDIYFRMGLVWKF
jgi:hypothetical protein